MVERLDRRTQAGPTFSLCEAVHDRFLQFIMRPEAMSCMTAISTASLYVLAAILEIAGCFAFWAWLRRDRTSWWVAAGVPCLVLFALCLTRIDAAFAGRAFAAYGGIYIVMSLLWLLVVEGIWPDRWDMAGQ